MGEDLRETEEFEALVDLVKFDYERTLSFVDGVVRVSANIRAFAITAWIGLLAAAVQTDDWSLAAIAALAASGFGLLDAYHGSLYTSARSRAYDMEKLLYQYFKYVERKRFDPDVAKDTLKALRRHRLGQLSNLPRFKARLLAQARPTFFYAFMYPGLVIGAGSAAAVISDLCLF